MTTATDIRRSDREAQDAAAAVAEAEDQLASGHQGVTAKRLHALRDTFRHASLSADGARAKAERDRQAARLAGLEQVGAEVDEAAAAAGAGLSEALQAAADACGRVRQIVAEHDARVAALIEAARDLGAEPAAPGGPRKTSAFVTVDAQGILHKRIRLRPAGERLGQILGHVLAGNVTDALAAAQMATELAEPQRSAHYFRAPGGGAVLTFSDPLPAGIATQARSGALTALAESEIIAYQAGETA